MQETNLSPPNDSVVNLAPLRLWKPAKSFQENKRKNPPERNESSIADVKCSFLQISNLGWANDACIRVSLNLPLLLSFDD
ncbi:hypothetical protein JTE90_000838 [Oedothorax gibbosus]|uniref:Uncharacterized protein n=1 Tax=Oedothorax gibbosus TaxID=931172 RepID=A0AAV6VSW4_9ARAC|nr:hypothetical protein JTE90_000838 [Oedothorax gibbosus]